MAYTVKCLGVWHPGSYWVAACLWYARMDLLARCDGSGFLVHRYINTTLARRTVVGIPGLALASSSSLPWLWGRAIELIGDGDMAYRDAVDVLVGCNVGVVQILACDWDVLYSAIFPSIVTLPRKWHDSVVRLISECKCIVNYLPLARLANLPQYIELKQPDGMVEFELNVVCATTVPGTVVCRHQGEHRRAVNTVVVTHPQHKYTINYGQDMTISILGYMFILCTVSAHGAN